MVDKKRGKKTPVNLEYIEPKHEVADLTDLQDGFTEMGFNKVTEGLRSKNYQAGSSGWKIDKDGTAEFQSITVGGYIPEGGAADDVNNHTTTINGGKITANSITASQIASNTITANEIASGTITANELAANSVTSDKIQANAVTTAKLAANAVTADKMNVSQLSAITADMGSITAGSININDKAKIDSNGNATFISSADLNVRAATTFESSTRFATSYSNYNVIFGVNGLEIIRSASAGYGICKWVGMSTPGGIDFTATTHMIVNATYPAPTTGGSVYFGFGDIAVVGNQHDFTDSHVGFAIEENGGVYEVYATQAKSGVETRQLILSNLDGYERLDLMFRYKHLNGVDYYARLNDGALQKVTLTTNQPIMAGSVPLQFSTASPDSEGFSIYVFSASIER